MAVKPLAIDLLTNGRMDVSITQMSPNYRDNPLEYRAWTDMKTRCYNPKFKDFHLYGGKGVKVFEPWRISFVQFYADVGPKPTPKHSLDRYPDSSGDYKPGNVRWATAKEQARNWGDRNHRYDLNGVIFTEAEWCERLGVSKNTLKERIERWGLERALSTPAIRVRTRLEDGTFAQATGH